MPNKRIDHQGEFRNALDKNRQRLLKTQDVCAICGRPIDKKKKWPDPMCGVVDHIIPVSRGGHPSDISNLQLVHNACNLRKSDKMRDSIQPKQKVVSNRDLPHSVDWINF